MSNRHPRLRPTLLSDTWTETMSDTYILIDGEPVATDWQTWAVWFTRAKADYEPGNINSRRVAAWEHHGVVVSTVFLGVNHGFGEGPPLLFETLVRGGRHDEYMDRYSTRDEALAGHQKIVEMVRGNSDG
jgi:hypothetical protein